MRKMSEASKERKTAYDLRYSAENITKRVIDFNRNSDEDVKILNHLDAQPNKTQYVKGLIKKDMGAGK